MESIAETLKVEYGVHVAPATLQSFVDNGIRSDAESLYRELLNTNITDFGLEVIAKDLGSQPSAILKGKLLLQVADVRDVTQPLRACADLTETGEVWGGLTQKESSKRLLRLELTDGHRKLVAVELTTLPHITALPMPGQKVLLVNATVKKGIVILDKGCKVVGGSVADLELEYQMLKAGVQRGQPTSAGDANTGPPKFVPFMDRQRHLRGDKREGARALTKVTPSDMREGDQGAGTSTKAPEPEITRNERPDTGKRADEGGAGRGSGRGAHRGAARHQGDYDSKRGGGREGVRQQGGIATQHGGPTTKQLGGRQDGYETGQQGSYDTQQGGGRQYEARQQGGYETQHGGGRQYEARQQGGYNTQHGGGRQYEARQQGGYDTQQGGGRQYEARQQGGYDTQQGGGRQGAYEARQQGGYDTQQGGGRQGAYEARQQGGYDTQHRHGGGYDQQGGRQGGGYEARQQGGYNTQQGGGRQGGGYQARQAGRGRHEDPHRGTDYGQYTNVTAEAAYGYNDEYDYTDYQSYRQGGRGGHYGH